MVQKRQKDTHKNPHFKRSNHAKNKHENEQKQEEQKF
jgi:hypothetical protein